MISKKGSENKVSSPSVVVEDLRLIKLFINKVFSIFNTAKSAEGVLQRHSAMTLIYKRQGFTLVELLVVVMIIGVLAAVALPKYKHAVAKSRFSSLMPVAKSIADAQEVHYMARHFYADENDRDALDVSFPQDEEKMSVTLSDTAGYDYVLAHHDKVPGANYIIYQKHSSKFADNIHCEASDEESNWLCEKGLGGRLLESGGSISTDKEYTTYILSGNEGTDAFPPSILKLKNEICGTQFTGANCIVDELQNTITTRECGTNMFFLVNAGYFSGATGCSEKVYDDTKDLVIDSVIKCQGSNPLRADERGCSPTGTGAYQDIYENGQMVGTYTCHHYDSNRGGCYGGMWWSSTDPSFYRSRTCATGAIDLDTYACAGGYSYAVDPGGEYCDLSTVDLVTGDCAS